MSQLARNAHPDFAFKNQKPRFSVAVNDENWFAQQCNSIKMLNAGAGDVLDLLDSTVGTISSNAPGWGTNRNRRMVETVANGGFNYYGVEFSSGLTFQGGNGDPGITIAIVGRFNGRGGSSNYANLVRDTGDDGLCINGSNQVTWVSGFARLTSSNSLSAGEYFTLIAGYEYNTATTFILLNGVLTTGSPGGFSINGSLEGWGGTSGQGNCAVEYNLFAHIPRIITTDQARAWSRDVYQIVRPAVPMAYAVSGGATNISCTAESLSLNASSSTVASGTTILAAIEALELSEQSATVAANHDVNATAESLEITELSASISSNADIAGSVESIELSSTASSVALDRDIAATAESIELTTTSAQIALDITVTATPESLSLESFAANIALGVIVSANAESIELTANTATVTADTSVTAGVKQISLSAGAATFALGTNVAASREALSLAGSTAAVVLDVSISATAASIVLSELSAQVGLSTDISANLESITVTESGAEIALDTGITATLESLTLSSLAATIEGGLAQLSSGLEYSLSEERMHYTLPVSRLHFTFKGGN